MENTNENTRERKIKLTFGAYPEVDVLFVTSDDKCFFDVHKAGAHAKNLMDGHVAHIKRGLLESDEQLLDEISKAKASLEEMTNAELKAKLDAAGVKYDKSAKKATLVELVTAMDEDDEPTGEAGEDDEPTGEAGEGDEPAGEAGEGDEPAGQEETK